MRASTIVDNRSPDTGQAAAGDTLTAIELRNIGVRFEVPIEHIVSFKEYVLRRLRGGIEHRELWALDGLDLRVPRGEVLGVVGRNGAGKSTLMKVISRVLHPTKGRVIVRGHVARLLELGAGFHFDLTGRENVFLNSALLGHPTRLVAGRFDEVVDFAELAEFIDGPIRNYSSGMLARLGFAVATLFSPDVLLLDAVLAVGDAAFQRKCLGRIGDFKRQGTTIVLVSHDADSISRHCDRAVWLDEGQVISAGATDDVLDRYGASQKT